MEKQASQVLYNLSENTVNAVVNYLATRPYKEVAGLVNAISQEVGPQLKKVDNAPQLVEAK